jgi:hypothetical protein
LNEEVANLGVHVSGTQNDLCFPPLFVGDFHDRATHTGAMTETCADP